MSGSFSTFHELLENWALEHPKDKRIIFGSIVKIFKDSKNLEIEFLSRSNMYGKLNSLNSFQLFMRIYASNKQFAIHKDRILVNIEPENEGNATFINKLRIKVTN